MPHVVYRPAQPDDLPAMANVFIETVSVYTVTGRVSPLAWNDPRHAAALLALACRQALETAAAPSPGMVNTPVAEATNAHTPNMANARTPETASVPAAEAVNAPKGNRLEIKTYEANHD